jgi:hypothetical protein
MIKIGTFFEQHVEKIVLAVFGILSIWLLITRVLLSPNQVVYEKEKYSPSAIDDRIYEDAERLRQKLSEPSEGTDAYQPKAANFLAVLDSAVRDVDTNLWPPQPYSVASRVDVDKSYRLPRIGEVNDVAIEHIRAVAYCPTARVTEQNLYYNVGHEPNDIDLVTVQAKFDVRGLYERFRNSFVENVEEKYADPCLAKPVFAAVQLQRRELNEDGTWSGWQNVPRSKIDHNRNLFDIAENVEDLPPGGLKIQLLQFENKLVQIELLQPDSYQFATASEEWFPPLLHRKYADIQKKQAMELRRIAREEERQNRENDNADNTDRRRSRRNDRTGIGGMFGGGDMLGGAGGAYGAGDTRSRRSRNDRLNAGGRGGLSDNYGGPDTRTRRGRGDRFTAGGGDSRSGLFPSDGRRTRGRDGLLDGYDGSTDTLGRDGQVNSELSEIYEEYGKLLLTPDTDFSRMREDMVFWAHDDTVEPRKSYQYRVRLGVFNPVAGNNQASERDASRSGQVILWSDFSDITKTVEIPGRLYFFARDIQEAAKTVTITVFKYVLGHWHKEDFMVGQGEVIGDVVETIPEEPEEDDFSRRGRSGRLTTATTVAVRSTDEATVPDMIDYGTGAVMVDTMAISDWTVDRNMRTRHYYDMLYSYDGTNIEHTPVGSTYWDDELRSTYSSVSRLEREPQEPFKAWSGAGRGGGGRGIDDFGGRGMLFRGTRDGFGG